MLYSLEEIRDLCDDDPDMVADLGNEFVIGVSESVQGLTDALANENIEQIKFFSHRMKPAVGSFHVDSIKEEVIDLDNIAKERIKQLEAGVLTKENAITPQMRQMVEHVCDVLTQVIVEMKAELNL
ncbi:MAG: hypothetical protein EBX41_01425 [Chitinophagia bacterium]|nr:hypothetical protein [Chitinophagia bacterium]